MKKSPYTKPLIESKFWQNKSLADMSKDEWEAVCDGCGRCCLHKFIDEGAQDEEASESEPSKAEEILFTNISCYLLNDKTCACTQYERRAELVLDCVSLSKENLKDVYFMPPSCSYRRLQEGKGLAHWHPLLNRGKKSKMHQQGITVRNRVINENDVDLNDFEDYIVSWPIDPIED